MSPIDAGKAPEVSREIDTALRWYWHLTAFILAAAVIFFRQPEALLHPQFFAEDGHVWFANAYNDGWFHSLFLTQDGYFQTLPRLGAAIALLVPLSKAPLATNLVGFFIQILPIPILLSSRMARWGSLSLRIAFGAMYLALPNSREVNVTITEAQWHMALVACLLLLASAPRGRVQHSLDLAVIVLCGLTGPFCILLLPIALIVFRGDRSRWRLSSLLLLCVTSAIQLRALLIVEHGVRAHRDLGASLEMLARIVAGQVYLGAILGHNSLGSLLETTPLVIVACLGTLALGWCIASANKPVRLFALFSILVFAASLLSPMVFPPPGITAWQILSGVPAIRYWFFPTLMFSWMLVWAAFSRRELLRLTAGLLLFLMLFGLIRDWRFPPGVGGWRGVSIASSQFQGYAAKFADLPAGAELLFPEDGGWTMRLVKH